MLLLLSVCVLFLICLVKFNGLLRLCILVFCDLFLMKVMVVVVDWLLLESMLSVMKLKLLWCVLLMCVVGIIWCWSWVCVFLWMWRFVNNGVIRLLKVRYWNWWLLILKLFLFSFMVYVVICLSVVCFSVLSGCCGIIKWMSCLSLVSVLLFGIFFCKVVLIIMWWMNWMIWCECLVCLMVSWSWIIGMVCWCLFWRYSVIGRLRLSMVIFICVGLRMVMVIWCLNVLIWLIEWIWFLWSIIWMFWCLKFGSFGMCFVFCFFFIYLVNLVFGLFGGLCLFIIWRILWICYLLFMLVCVLSLVGF